MAAVGKLRVCAASPSGKHSASVLFLHGSGDSGRGLRAWLKDILGQDLSFSHIKVIYPTAPARPYTPMHGAPSTVWFDRYQISADCPDHLESIDAMAAALGSVIQDQVLAGVPKHRLVIGGFSMGGAMALHLACRFHPDVAGVFALSSFLNKDSLAFQAAEQRSAAALSLPDLLQCHGSRDALVPPRWGETTADRLQAAGMNATFHSFPHLQHQLCLEEVELLRTWILSRLPESSSS